VAVLLRTLETFGLGGLTTAPPACAMASSAIWPTRGAGREQARLDREQREMVEQFARRFGGFETRAEVAHFSLELFHALANLHQLAPAEGRLLGPRPTCGTSASRQRRRASQAFALHRVERRPGRLHRY